jgi:hypothetical protein
VTSARKLLANRANARKSTGPRTPAGKARVAGNARRHGLSVPAARDPALAEAIETLARAIAGAEAAAPRHALAGRIAQAQIELVRVRSARRALLAQAGDNPGATAKLAAIDDYERRARSQRRQAMRAFDAETLRPTEVDVAGEQSQWVKAQ